MGNSLSSMFSVNKTAKNAKSIDEAPTTPITVESKASLNSPRANLESTIRSKELVPLWNTGSPVTLPEPRTKQIPAVWKYAETKELLLQSAKLVDASESERRALIMVNPGPKVIPHTLDTILSAHQLLLPGEKAICHRHTPFAVRFLIEGEKGYTAIDGKKMYMEPGDMIITPVWKWHDHGNDGDTNVIWMDGLNLPFFKLNPIDFLELYEDKFGIPTHESKLVSDEECSEMKFPWKKVKAELDNTASDSFIYEYQIPGGKPVNSVMSAFAERISQGKATAPRQDTSNRIYQVHSGSGETLVTSPKDGTKYTLTWGPGDTFAIPSWHRFTIHATGDSPVYLFMFSDKAMLDNLDLYRESD